MSSSRTVNALSRSMGLALAVAVSCSEPFKPPCATRVTLGPKETTTLISLNHQPVSVLLELTPPFACPGGNPLCTHVETQVLDPMNHPLEHDASPPTSSQSSGYATTVTFTPTTPGDHFLTTRFEPSLGAVHRSVMVAEDHTRDQPFLDALVVPDGCNPTVVTQHLVMCSVKGTLFIVRPAESLTFTLDDIIEWRYSAPSLWAWGPGQMVRRYEVLETGAPVLGEHADISAFESHSAAVTASELTLFSQNTAEHYVVRGNLMSRSTATFEGLTFNALSDAVALGPNQFGVLTNRGVCSVSLDTRAGECTAAELSRVSVDGRGFWASWPNSISYFRFVGGQPASVSVSYSLTVSYHAGPIPSFETDQNYFTLHPDFHVDAFTKRPNAAFQVGVLSDVLWELNTTDHTLRAMRR